MKKRKIYIGILMMFFILLLIIIGIKLLKNKNANKNIANKEEFKEMYSGLMQCIKFNDNSIENNSFSNIVYLEVEDNKIKTIKVMKVIYFNDAKDYEDFKNNEQLLKPVFDDERYVIEYVISDETEANNEDMNEYTKNYTDKGYECEKVRL